MELSWSVCPNWQLLLTNVFENTGDKTQKAWFFSFFFKIWIVIDCCTKNDNGRLLKVQKVIRKEICHLVLRYAKRNNKYIKTYSQQKGSSYVAYIGKDNIWLYNVSKLPTDGLRWIKNASFTEKIIKILDEKYNVGYIFEGDAKSFLVKIFFVYSWHTQR